MDLLKVSCIGVGNESLSTKKPSSSSVERADRNDPIFADTPLDADVLTADQLIFCIGAPMEDKSAKESSKAMVGCATASQYERNSTKHSGKNVRFVRFYPPPPSDYYTKENAFFAFAEAGAGGRRPGVGFA